MKSDFNLLDLTRSQAAKFLEFNNFDGQRPLSDAWVEDLQFEVDEGHFHVGQIAIYHNGTDYLIDGQHQCTARLRVNADMKVCVHEYWSEGDSEAEMCELFSRYIGGKKRRADDVAWGYAVQHGMKQYGRKCVSLCRSALGWIHSGYNMGGLSYRENAELLIERKADVKFVHSVLWKDGTAPPPHIAKSPIVSAMLLTKAKGSEECRTFWGGVRDGEMLTRKDAAFRLRDWLRSATVRGGNSTRNDGKSVTNSQLRDECVRAWNCYRDDSEYRPRKKYVPSKDRQPPKVK